MKIACVLFVPWFAVPSLAEETQIPPTVFRVAQFGEAAKQAAAQRKAISIVLSTGSGEGTGTISATEEAFKELAGWTVTVFVESEGKGQETFLLPPPLATALIEDGASLLPKVLIGPPTADEAWAVIAAQKKQSAKDFGKEIRTKEPGLRVKVAGYFKDKTPPPPVLPGDKQLAWGRAIGGHYRGKFVKLEKEQLFIADTKGKQSGGINLKDLAPEAQRYAMLIAGAPGAPKPGATPAMPIQPVPLPAAAFENWQNKDGKVIRAAFVALNDNKVTLKTDTGKEYTLPVESLSLPSQARARELAQPAEKRRRD